MDGAEQKAQVGAKDRRAGTEVRLGLAMSEKVVVAVAKEARLETTPTSRKEYLREVPVVRSWCKP